MGPGGRFRRNHPPAMPERQRPNPLGRAHRGFARRFGSPSRSIGTSRSIVARLWHEKRGELQVRERGFEPPRGIIPTRPSTWRVCQFRHSRSLACASTAYARPLPRQGPQPNAARRPDLRAAGQGEGRRHGARAISGSSARRTCAPPVKEKGGGPSGFSDRPERRRPARCRRGGPRSGRPAGRDRFRHTRPASAAHGPVRPSH